VAEQRTIPGTDVALTIAGSDSSGGAGIQADLKTFSVMRIYGASVITAITAQNTRGVQKSFYLDPALVEAQIDSVAGDLNVRATKVGMLGSKKTVDLVVAALKRNTLQPLVVDPVMISKSGASLIDDDAIAAITKKLLPLAAIVTPNKHEAARLLGQPKPIADITAAKAAAKEICVRFGAKSCIVKGFRRPDEQEGQAVAIFYDGQELRELVSAWRPTENTHGSGCVFAAAITAALAGGQELAKAVETAKTLVSEAIRQCTNIGNGVSPVNPLAYLDLK